MICTVDGGVSNHSNGASIGHRFSEKAGNSNGYLDGEGTGDTGGGDQGSSISRNAEETCTPKQMELYTNRFEEWYDLYDPAYVEWLEVAHPVDRYMLLTAPATPGSNRLHKSKSVSSPGSTSSLPVVSHNSGTSVEHSHSTSASSSGSTSPVPEIWCIS